MRPAPMKQTKFKLKLDPVAQGKPLTSPGNNGPAANGPAAPAGLESFARYVDPTGKVSNGEEHSLFQRIFL